LALPLRFVCGRKEADRGSRNPRGRNAFLTQHLAAQSLTLGREEFRMNVTPMGVYTAQILTVLLGAALWLLGMAGLILASAKRPGYPAPALAVALAPLFAGSTRRSIDRAIRSETISRPAAPSRAPPSAIPRPRWVNSPRA
jgi:hypothetical protein